MCKSVDELHSISWPKMHNHNNDFNISDRFESYYRHKHSLWTVLLDLKLSPMFPKMYRVGQASAEVGVNEAIHWYMRDITSATRLSTWRCTLSCNVPKNSVNMPPNFVMVIIDHWSIGHVIPNLNDWAYQWINAVAHQRFYDGNVFTYCPDNEELHHELAGCTCINKR